MDAAGRAACEARCERLLARSELLDTSDIDWAAAVPEPVAPEVLDCLVYMRDVEGFTSRYLDGLAGHPATLGDSLVSRFLDVWRREEGAHADALDRWLEAYERRHGVRVPIRQQPPPDGVDTRERLLVTLTRPVGHVVTAAHMVWGAVNELLTMNGYRLLARRTGGQPLSELLGRIADQEARHCAFYRLQAEWRLDASPVARRVVRRIVGSTWTPVGVGDGYKRADEFQSVLGYLGTTRGAPAAIDRMDATIARIPGLADLRPFRRLLESDRALTPTHGREVDDTLALACVERELDPPSGG